MLSPSAPIAVWRFVPTVVRGAADYLSANGAVITAYALGSLPRAFDRNSMLDFHIEGVQMHRPSRNYYQIYRVDHKRNQEQMVAEIEGLQEAEKLVEKYLRNMNASEKRDEISYYRSTLPSGVPKMFGLSRAS